MLFRLLLFHLRETISIRTLAFFVAVLLMTVFIFAAMPALTSTDDRISYDLSLSIVDPEGSVISQTLATVLGGMNGMGQVYLEDMASAQQKLKNNEILMILEIPKDFFEFSQSFVQRPAVTLWLNDRMPSETAIFVRALRSIADSISGMQAAYIAFAQAIEPLYTDIESYNSQLSSTFSQVLVWMVTRRAVVTLNETARLSTPTHVISAVVCLLCMQTGLLLMSQAGEERKNGVNRRLALSKAPWYASPLTRGITGLLWVGISFAPLVIGLKTVYPQLRLELIIPAIFALYWITSTLCQAAGYLTSGNTLALPGAWLIILIFLILGGCIYPQTLLPSVIKPLVYLSPAYFAYQTVYAGLEGTQISSNAIIAFSVMTIISAIILRFSWHKALCTNPGGIAL